jgi:UDP-2,4-diacetamido-2,4,6-trideoxy-beta-L-altropyranose hydrolase
VNIVFRVNSSAQIGAGHVMRSLALAANLRARGARIHFVTRPMAGNIDARIIAAGYPLTTLSAADTDEARYPWVGVPLEREIEESLAAFRRIGRVSWITVDNYGLDALWERRVREYADCILAVDDLADRAHDVNALLDQNPSAAGAARYAALVPPGTRIFVGPQFAQLREQFIAARPHARHRDGSIRSILIAFGSDLADHTQKTAEAISGVLGDTVEVNIVLAREAPAYPVVGTIVDRHPHWALHAEVDDMAALMVLSDFAFGAGGTTSYERAYLGLPAIAWAIADNQLEVVAGLAAAGAVVPLPPSCDVPAIARALEQLVGDAASVRALGEHAADVMREHGPSVASLYRFLLDGGERFQP